MASWRACSIPVCLFVIDVSALSNIFWLSLLELAVFTCCKPDASPPSCMFRKMRATRGCKMIAYAWFSVMLELCWLESITMNMLCWSLLERLDPVPVVVGDSALDVRLRLSCGITGSFAWFEEKLMIGWKYAIVEFESSSVTFLSLFVTAWP